MKKLVKISAIALLMLASFSAGALFAARSHFGSPIVTVELENASSQRIASVLLEHENGSVVAKDISPHSSQRIHFYTAGESGYKLNVTFENGQVVSSEAGYVEAGYIINEKISETSIQTTTGLSRYEP